jgi:hypothetical protein
LLAIGRDSGGIKLAEAVQQTAGSPYAIRIEGDKESVRTNRIFNRAAIKLIKG